MGRSKQRKLNANIFVSPYVENSKLLPNSFKESNLLSKVTDHHIQSKVRITFDDKLSTYTSRFVLRITASHSDVAKNLSQLCIIDSDTYGSARSCEFNAYEMYYN